MQAWLWRKWGPRGTLGLSQSSPANPSLESWNSIAVLTCPQRPIAWRRERQETRLMLPLRETGSLKPILSVLSSGSPAAFVQTAFANFSPHVLGSISVQLRRFSLKNVTVARRRMWKGWHHHLRFRSKEIRVHTLDILPLCSALKKCSLSRRKLYRRLCQMRNRILDIEPFVWDHRSLQSLYTRQPIKQILKAFLDMFKRVELEITVKGIKRLS